MSAKNIWPRIEKTETCWHWTGPVNARGTPDCSLDGERMPVRRALHYLETGEFTERRIGVSCGHQRCVAPAHFVWRTNSIAEHQGVLAALEAGMSRQEVAQQAGRTVEWVSRMKTRLGGLSHTCHQAIPPFTASGRATQINILHCSPRCQTASRMGQDARHSLRRTLEIEPTILG